MAEEKVTEAVKAGAETTEYARTKSASVWGTVGMILGAIVAFGPQVMAQIGGVVGESNQAYLIGGLVLSISSVVYKFGIDAGYIQSRTNVKVKAEEVKIATAMKEAAVTEEE
jgi:hypothetical protein